MRSCSRCGPCPRIGAWAYTFETAFFGVSDASSLRVVFKLPPPPRWTHFSPYTLNCTLFRFLSVPRKSDLIYQPCYYPKPEPDPYILGARNRVGRRPAALLGHVHGIIQYYVVVVICAGQLQVTVNLSHPLLSLTRLLSHRATGWP